MASESDLSAVALGEEFRPSPMASDFELVRASSTYIPLLKASYALANQEPFAFPPGYEAIGQIRVDETEAAQAMPAEATAREAVRSDLAAAAAAIANPEAFGFVVREEDSGSILLCLRGTQTPREWFRNFTAVPNPFTLVPGFGLVHLGFELMHRSVRNSIVNGLVAVAPDTRITIVAHSLGAAMGTLAAVDLKRNFGRTNVDICTFGGPRVGKVSFRRNFNREVPRCFRVTNLGDVVPHVPSLVTLWNHVGEEIEVDGAMENAHSLDAYLAGLRSIGTVREISPIGEMTALAAAVVSLRVP